MSRAPAPGPNPPAPRFNRPLQTADTRITIQRRTPRWHDRKVTAADALDFWSFAAGAANVVMQLSMPGVGHGVVESKVVSGSLMHHPWKRARTTFSYVAVALLGSADDRAAYREAVNGAHRQVRSTPDSPVKYNAFDRDLQMWVAACLFVGLEDSYQLLRGELTPANAEIFYQSAFPLGTTLQVSEGQWPSTRAEFDDYWNAACEQVLMDDAVRGYLTDLLNLRMVSPIMRPGSVTLLRFLTTGFLAPVFRDALQVTWSPRQQNWFERLFLLVALANRFLPRFIRQGGSSVLLADIRGRVRRGKRLI